MKKSFLKLLELFLNVSDWSELSKMATVTENIEMLSNLLSSK